MPKFFIDISCSGDTGGIITLNGKEALHIISALRGKPGDSIIVCDRHGMDMACEITLIHDGKVELSIVDKAPADTEPVIRITLFQGLPKGDKMDYIIQKAVELGVYEIVPMITEYGIVKTNGNSDKKTERYARISQAAAKQSMRGIVPRVTGFMSLEESVSYGRKLDMAYVAYEHEKKTVLRDILKRRDFKTMGIFIGPEGGFSPKEMDLFAINRIQPVTLGKRILRTETAGLVAIAILNYEMEI